MTFTVGTDTVSIAFKLDEPWFHQLDAEKQGEISDWLSNVARIQALLFNAVIVNPGLIPLYFRAIHGLSGMLREENASQQKENDGGSESNI